MGDVDESVLFGVREGWVVDVDAVLVLHGRDGRVAAGLFDLVDGDFGEAEVSDLAFLPEVVDGAELVGEGYGWVDAVQVVQVDAVDGEATEAEFDALA